MKTFYQLFGNYIPRIPESPQNRQIVIVQLDEVPRPGRIQRSEASVF